MIISHILIVGVPNMIHWNRFPIANFATYECIHSNWYKKKYHFAEKLVLFIQDGKIFVDILAKIFISDLPVEKPELVKEKSNSILVE